MTRFFLTALFLFPLSVFAQDGQAPIGQLPRNPALLMQMREKLTLDLHHVQQMLTLVNPSDTQSIELLKNQQADLTKQLKDVMQHLQAPAIQSPQPDIYLPPLPVRREYEMPTIPNIPRSADPALVPGGVPQPVQPLYPTYNPPNMQGVPMGVADPNAAWENPWAPKPPKELTEIKQTVDSLRKEIADLKETVKALETQIQLLNRNILLSEKMRENGH
jgi:prefoldin subunit 5